MSESRPIEVGFRSPPETPRPGPVVRARATRVTPEGANARDEMLAAEEPLEIRVQHRGADHQIAVTMRTPGNDFELAVGFLFTEGMVRAREDIATVSYCKSGPPEQLYNIVTVELRDAADFEPVPRTFYATSSCGVCGKASIDAIHSNGCARLDDGPVVQATIFSTLPGALRASQRVFEQTGGLHAAGLFDASGDLKLLREDIGRHNAVDKVVGKMVLGNIRGGILQVSGRASFEIVQKAVVARLPIVSAVSAPSSLAVSLAEDFNLTLVGFVRDASFNIYSGASRIAL